MNYLTNLLVKIGILKNDLDYHLIRASMVIIFLFFGYQKWFEYEAQALLPYISNGPLIFWMIRFSVFGEPLTFWESPNGCLVGCCSWASGTRSWEFSEGSEHVFPLSPPSRSSRLCLTAGPRLRAGSPL